MDKEMGKLILNDVIVLLLMMATNSIQNNIIRLMCICGLLVYLRLSHKSKNIKVGDGNASKRNKILLIIAILSSSIISIIVIVNMFK